MWPVVVSPPLPFVRSSHTHQRRTQKISNPKRTTEISHMWWTKNNKNMGGPVFSFQLSPLFFFLFFRKDKKSSTKKRRKRKKKEWASFSLVRFLHFLQTKIHFTPDIFCLVLFCFHSQRICVLGASCSFRGSNNKQQNVYQIRA